MNIDKNITKQIGKVKYLATENTYIYRSIIRIMYKLYEQMKIYKKAEYQELLIDYYYNILKKDYNK